MSRKATAPDMILEQMSTEQRSSSLPATTLDSLAQQTPNATPPSLDAPSSRSSVWRLEYSLIAISAGLITGLALVFFLVGVDLAQLNRYGYVGLFAISLMGSAFGFAVGGLAVFGYLVSQPYCANCSRYLSAKGKQVRYTGDAEGLQAMTGKVLESIGSGAIASAIKRHSKFGSEKYQHKVDHLRSTIAVHHCKKCGQHWVKFSVEKQSGDDWKEIPELTVDGFIDDVVNV